MTQEEADTLNSLLLYGFAAVKENADGSIESVAQGELLDAVLKSPKDVVYTTSVMPLEDLLTQFKES